MKLLLTVLLASMMTLPALASRSDKDKAEGKEKGRASLEKKAEAVEKARGKSSQTQTKSVTSNKNQLAESLFKTFDAIKAKGNYSFKSSGAALLPEGIVAITEALRQRAINEKIDATMVQSAETIVENFRSTLEMVNEKFPREQAEKINELADSILQAAVKSVEQKSPADVKADIALMMTMVAQAKMFESQGKAVESYMSMVNNLLSLRAEGALQAGAVRKAMGEDLYAKALKNCLSA